MTLCLSPFIVAPYDSILVLLFSFYLSKSTFCLCFRSFITFVKFCFIHFDFFFVSALSKAGSLFILFRSIYRIFCFSEDFNRYFFDDWLIEDLKGEAKVLNMVFLHFSPLLSKTLIEISFFEASLLVLAARDALLKREA